MLNTHQWMLGGGGQGRHIYLVSYNNVVRIWSIDYQLGIWCHNDFNFTPNSLKMFPKLQETGCGLG